MEFAASRRASRSERLSTRAAACFSAQLCYWRIIACTSGGVAGGGLPRGILSGVVGGGIVILELVSEQGCPFGSRVLQPIAPLVLRCRAAPMLRVVLRARGLARSAVLMRL